MYLYNVDGNQTITVGAKLHVLNKFVKADKTRVVKGRKGAWKKGKNDELQQCGIVQRSLILLHLRGFYCRFSFLQAEVVEWCIVRRKILHEEHW